MATPKYFMWEYYSKVEVGAGCRSFIPQRFQHLGCQRVALITDPGIVQAGLVKMILDVFEAQGAVKIVGIYDKVEQDALMRIVNDCARWCRELAADGLLAVGGGSVLDTTKGVKAMMGMKVTDIRDIMPNNLGFYMGTWASRWAFLI
jgi:alcohol dehydrogenase class IV